MSIVTEAGRKVRICCDTCGDEYDEFDQGEFGKMVAEAKSDGWRIEMGMKTFIHTCPNCVKPRLTPLDAAKLMFPTAARNLSGK